MGPWRRAAGLDVAVDASGNAHVAGRTSSTDFPTALALQPANAGDIDAFVTRLDARGRRLVFSTYLGESAEDIAAGTALDRRGGVWVSGNTQSTDFPTRRPIQARYAGNMDGFVARLTARGSRLRFSTYLGGTDVDNAIRITGDPAGGAHLAGATGSTDFPATPSVLQPGFGGGALDAFVAAIDVRPRGPGKQPRAWLQGRPGTWLRRRLATWLRAWRGAWLATWLGVWLRAWRGT